MDDQVKMVYTNTFNKTQLLLSQVFELELESSTLLPASASNSDHGAENLASKVTRDTLPSALVRMVKETPLQDRGQATYGVCYGMMQLANNFPTYVDDFLAIYLEAIVLSPDKRLNSSDYSTLSKRSPRGIFHIRADS